MSDDLLVTVRKALAELDALMPPPSRTITLDTPIVRALLDRCTTAEAEAARLRENNERLRERLEQRDALLRLLEKDGRAWIDVEDTHNARLRLVYASESEVAQLRERHAAAVKLLADVEWAGTDSVYLTRFCVWCDANERWGHADTCRYVALMSEARKGVTP